MGFESRKRDEIFLFPLRSNSSSFPKVKHPGRQAGLLPPSGVEVKREWTSTSASPCAIMACEGKTFPFFPEVIWF